MCGGSPWNKTTSRRLCLKLHPVVMSATCILCFPWQSNPQMTWSCSSTIFSTRNCKPPDSPATLVVLRLILTKSDPYLPRLLEVLLLLFIFIKIVEFLPHCFLLQQQTWDAKQPLTSSFRRWFRSDSAALRRTALFCRRVFKFLPFFHFVSVTLRSLKTEQAIDY
jgi:hypothetical protein